MHVDRSKLAKILGYDVKTIDRMVSDGMPYVSRPAAGKRSWVFDTAAVLIWMTRDELAEQDKASRLKLAQAKAGLKWLEYGEGLGMLVRIHDVIPILEEALQTLRSRMLAVPGRLEQLLAIESDPDVVQRLLQEELDDIIEQSERPLRSLNARSTK